MLSWLAVHLESGAIERDLEHRSTLALAAAGHDWASVAFSGRDGLLVGRAADAGQRDQAAAVVANVWGVRIVETRVALAEGSDPPPPMPEPKPKSEKGPAPWAKVGLPVASAAKELEPHRTLNDVAPSAVGGPSADDVVLATGDIGGSVDLPPASTVQAQDEVELPATAIAAETAEAKQVPPVVETATLRRRSGSPSSGAQVRGGRDAPADGGRRRSGTRRAHSRAEACGAAGTRRDSCRSELPRRPCLTTSPTRRRWSPRRRWRRPSRQRQSR